MTQRRNTTPKKRGASAARFYTIVLIVLAIVAVVLEALAMGPLENTFWGFHLYAFLQPLFAVSSWALLLLSAVILLRGADGSPVEEVLARRPSLTAIGVAVMFTTLFWFFRSQQTLLGDGQPLVTDLPGGQDFHPRQPLTMWLQQVLFRTLGGVVAGDGTDPQEVARRTVAIGSTAIGFVFALVANLLATTITRLTGHTKRIVLPAMLILLTQGYALLFFGYIENYTLYTLAVATYLLCGLLSLQGRLTLQVVTIVFVLSLGLHLSTMALAPSLLFLFAWGARLRERRRDALLGVGLLIAGLVALDLVLRSMSPGYTLAGGMLEMTRIAQEWQGGGTGLSYMFSWIHIRDFLNEHFLIGPLAALLFVPAFVYAVRHRTPRTPAALFLVLAAASYLVGSWAMSEPLLGYARDWDLFAPAGVCYAVAGLYLVLSHVSAERRLAGLLGFAVVFSALQLVPWIRVNHSERLSLERFKTLPLGGGRTEVTVGNWYFRHGDNQEAKAWFEKGLEVNPYNGNAYAFLGMIFMREENYEMACKAYGNAVLLRPDKREFRNNYTLALITAEKYEEALPELEWLIERMPNRLDYWQSLTEILEKLRRVDELKAIAPRAAVAVATNMSRGTPTESRHVTAGVILTSIGYYDDALEHFRAAVGINPDSYAGLFDLGHLLTQMGRAEEARPYLARFRRVYPNDFRVEWINEQIGRAE